jgi:Flp pilus assembly protein TadG
MCSKGNAACSGQNLIELALLLPLLALVMLGAIDLGRAFIAHNRLTDAVMEGANYGARNPTQTTTIINRAYAEAQGQLGTTGTDFTIDATAGVRCYQGQTTTLLAGTPAGSCAAEDAEGRLIVKPGDTVEVTAQYTFRPITPLIAKFLSANLRATVRVAIL